MQVRGLYLQVLVLVLAPAREKGAREYLCCTVPEGALETVELARGGRAPAPAVEPPLQQGARCEEPSRYGGQSARSKANVRPNRWIAQCIDARGGAETRSFRTMSPLLREYSVRTACDIRQAPSAGLRTCTRALPRPSCCNHSRAELWVAWPGCKKVPEVVFNCTSHPGCTASGAYCAGTVSAGV